MAEKVSIVAVLVLYERTLEETVTWRSLASQVDSRLHAQAAFHLLVCENSAPVVAPSMAAMPAWVEYAGIRENRGLAWAYNRGLECAVACKAEWLLTLDQDTALPPDFLLRLVAEASSLQDAPAPERPIVALVPQLANERGTVLSPFLVTLAGERVFERGYIGCAAGEVRAYNSGSLIRVAALRAVGGYDRRFWLDFLDHALFHALAAAGGRVRILGDVQLRHRLSLHDDRGSLGEERFRNFSAAESAFRDLHASRLAGAVFTGRLLLRLMNQLRRGDPNHFVRTTLATLKARLRLGRKERLARWEAGLASLSVSPRISTHGHGSVPDPGQ